MFRQITIAGEPMARGQQYGRQTAQEIRLSVASYARFFAYLRGMDWAEMQHEARCYLPVLERHAPDLLDEMRGTAAGAELEFTEILALNVRTELIAGFRRETAHPGFAAAVERNRGADILDFGECTTVAALGGATAAGTPLLAQTWDWYGSQRAACVILRIEAPDEPTILTVAEAGMVAKIGLNDAGVGVALNILRTAGDGAEPGMPIHVQLRRVLQARSAADAIARVHEVRAAASSCITVVDRGGTAVSLEVTPHGVGHLEPRDNLLAHTNHCLTELVAPHQAPIVVAGGTEPRFGRATALLQAQQGAITRATMIDILRDHEDAPTCICRHAVHNPLTPYVAESVTGVVVDVAAGELLVAAGLPCQTPFEIVALHD